MILVLITNGYASDEAKLTRNLPISFLLLFDHHFSPDRRKNSANQEPFNRLKMIIDQLPRMDHIPRESATAYFIRANSLIHQTHLSAWSVNKLILVSCLHSRQPRYRPKFSAGITVSPPRNPLTPIAMVITLLDVVVKAAIVNAAGSARCPVNRRSKRASRGLIENRGRATSNTSFCGILRDV